MTETLRHARYVLGENPVTGFAFGLFTFQVLCALFGPALVPYDPLASDTALALTGPSRAHLFGTDQLGRDIFSRISIPLPGDPRSPIDPDPNICPLYGRCYRATDLCKEAMDLHRKSGEFPNEL
jgi:hypothetical protein